MGQRKEYQDKYLVVQLIQNPDGTRELHRSNGQGLGWGIGMTYDTTGIAMAVAKSWSTDSKVIGTFIEHVGQPAVVKPSSLTTYKETGYKQHYPTVGLLHILRRLIQVLPR